MKKEDNPMAKVTFVPGSGTLAAYLSGEIDHHAAQTLRREIESMPRSMTACLSC